MIYKKGRRNVDPFLMRFILKAVAAKDIKPLARFSL